MEQDQPAPASPDIVQVLREQLQFTKEQLQLAEAEVARVHSVARWQTGIFITVFLAHVGWTQVDQWNTRNHLIETAKELADVTVENVQRDLDRDKRERDEAAQKLDRAQGELDRWKPGPFGCAMRR